MRTIKFRGKRVDNGEWVYGHGISQRPVTQIICEKVATLDFHYEVDPSTVGQFTGITDKNGKDIYEGDLIKFQKFANYDDEIPRLSRHTAKVIFKDVSFSWQIIKEGSNTTFFNSYETEPLSHTCDTWGLEIIGNIHDNPELLNQSK